MPLLLSTPKVRLVFDRQALKLRDPVSWRIDRPFTFVCLKVFWLEALKNFVGFQFSYGNVLFHLLFRTLIIGAEMELKLISLQFLNWFGSFTPLEQSISRFQILSLVRDSWNLYCQKKSSIIDPNATFSRWKVVSFNQLQWNHKVNFQSFVLQPHGYENLIYLQFLNWLGSLSNFSIRI